MFPHNAVSSLVELSYPVAVVFLAAAHARPSRPSREVVFARRLDLDGGFGGNVDAVCRPHWLDDRVLRARARGTFCQRLHVVSFCVFIVAAALVVRDYAREPVAAADDGDCAGGCADGVFVIGHGLEAVVLVVAGTRGVCECCGDGAVVLAGADFVVDEDTPGERVEECVDPAARREECARDEEEGFWQVPPCHGDHATNGNR
jgi:hypothetical protein